MSISNKSFTGGLNNKSLSKELSEKPRVRLAIRDTEFLIRLILNNQIDGKDVEIASEVLKKVKEVHNNLMMKSQELF